MAKKSNLNTKWTIIGVVGVIILLFIATIAGLYNGLVSGRENVNTKLANVQSQYQRRADLIPNLVSTVKGAADFEQSTLENVTNTRAKATQITIDPSNATPEQLQRYQEAQGELSQALSRLLAVTENYPELTATQNFKDLQVQLEGTENRIAVARNDFNEAARTYNTTTQSFPTNITAGVFGFKTFTYFQADAGSDKAPSVDFN
ncbi:MAG: LemA family protein [Candidatus Saccharibacteria bacterium]|nr:LemA family protein [Candidatus Saccharibacteria bacterium]